MVLQVMLCLLDDVYAYSLSLQIFIQREGPRLHDCLGGKEQIVKEGGEIKNDLFPTH